MKSIIVVLALLFCFDALQASAAPIIRARASFEIVVVKQSGIGRSQPRWPRKGEQSGIHDIPSARLSDVSVQKNISVTLAPSASIVLDSASEWLVPSWIGGTVNFGFIKLSEITDNNLDVCGNGSEHCNTAFLRMYTIGESGPGLWCGDTAQSAPLFAGLTGEPFVSIGLNVAGAVVVQSMSIPSYMHALHLSDFSPEPRYNILAQFNYVSPGVYRTTLVLEYGLLGPPDSLARRGAR